MSFAKVTIVGNLGREPEVRTTPSGARNVQFTIAADGRKKDAPSTWFRVTAWDKDAERLEAMMQRGFIAKGKSLYVEGQLEQRDYTDANGQPRVSLDVTLSDWQFVGGKQDTQDAGYGSYGDQSGRYAADNFAKSEQF